MKKCAYRFKFLRYAISIIAALSITFIVSAQSTNKELSGDLIIFHAGSLSLPMKQVTAEFNKKYPEIRVLLESAGSVASARKITDLGRECDIMLSADYAVIDKMLIPKFADWNIKFASNELSIVYTDKSRHSDKINEKNWYNILNYEDVDFGRADPNSDPCGYRTVLMLQLAEKYYNIPGLANRILSQDNRFIRPKEVDLIALLESNSIDYIFLYKSVAIQHGLKYLNLPDDINLKNPSFASKYGIVATTINGSEPGTKTTVKGEPMVYGVTILRDAPNKRAAEAYLKFLLEKDNGMRIMEKNGQPSVVPMINENKDKIPVGLRRFVR